MISLQYYSSHFAACKLEVFANIVESSDGATCEINSDNWPNCTVIMGVLFQMHCLSCVLFELFSRV